MKRILRKCQASGDDPFIALLNLRNTPIEGLNTSPGQRLLGRRTKSLMPIADSKLKPGYADPEHEARLKDSRRVTGAPRNMKDLTRLSVGETVRTQPIRTRESVYVRVCVCARVERSNGEHPLI